jgi:hypothetical protein
MPMDSEQYLLGKLAEECSELAQRALKAQQFGLDEVQEGQSKSNRERLLEEYLDVIIIMAFLEKRCGVQATASSELSEANFQAKLEKVAKYAALAQRLGKLESVSDLVKP